MAEKKILKPQPAPKKKEKIRKDYIDNARESYDELPDRDPPPRPERPKKDE